MTMNEIERAAEYLHAGKLVAFPTETVYGLGANALNPHAVASIYAAKGRPADHPLIVHGAAGDTLLRLARRVPETAWKLVEHFWPGPLTLVLPRAADVPDAVTGGQDTVALRMPDHPVALALLAEFGGPLVAPSANRFGRISPTTAEHVREELGGAVDFILDGGPCQVGVESTIVDLSADTPRLLRPGGVARDAIEAILGRPLAGPAQGGPRTPGALLAHYAPVTALHLLTRAEIDVKVCEAVAEGRKVAVLAPEPDNVGPACRWLEPPADPAAYARVLYAWLRDLDRSGVSAILVQTPPLSPRWEAVHDRLTRAARGSGT
jgi:L-threonylcarbamoyladenylate synthase